MGIIPREGQFSTMNIEEIIANQCYTSKFYSIDIWRKNSSSQHMMERCNEPCLATRKPYHIIQNTFSLNLKTQNNFIILKNHNNL